MALRSMLRKAEEEPSQRFHELLSIEGTVSPKGPKPPEPLAQSISVQKRVARRDLLRPPSGDQVVQVLLKPLKPTAAPSRDGSDLDLTKPSDTQSPQ
jgi:hypothetical protein